jgi:phosphate uptake regulator
LEKSSKTKEKSYKQEIESLKKKILELEEEIDQNAVELMLKEKVVY